MSTYPRLQGKQGKKLRDKRRKQHERKLKKHKKADMDLSPFIGLDYDDSIFLPEILQETNSKLTSDRYSKYSLRKYKRIDMGEINHFYEDSEPNESESERSENEHQEDVFSNDEKNEMDDKSDSVHEEQGMDEEEEDDSSDDDEMPLPTFLLNKDLFDMNPIPEERSLAEMSPKVQKKMEHKTNKMFAKAKEKGVFRVFQFLLNNEFIHSFTFEPIPVKSNHLRNMIDKYCEKFSLRMETRKVKDWYIISVSKPLSMTSTSKKSEVRSSKPVKSTEPEQMTLMEGLSKPIGEDNIGNSLLKKMGWDGGALGQRGDGILEPIDIHIKRDNKGIGHDHKDNEEVHTSMSFVRSNK